MSSRPKPAAKITGNPFRALHEPSRAGTVHLFAVRSAAISGIELAQSIAATNIPTIVPNQIASPGIFPVWI